MTTTLKKGVFWPRLKAFYDSWKTGGNGWGDSSLDSIVVVSGRANDDVLYSRTLSVLFHFFEYSITDSVYIFTKDNTLTIICSPKAKKAFETLGSSENGFNLVLIEKSDKGKEAIDAQKAIDLLKAHGTKTGVIAKDQPIGVFAETVTSYINKHMERVDVTLGVGIALQAKDAAAVNAISTASSLLSTVIREKVVNVLQSVAQGKKLTHSKIADTTEAFFEKLDEYVKETANGEPLDVGEIETAYTPIVQSRTYDLRPSAQSNDAAVDPSVVTVSTGIRYHSYCANIARTFFFSPSTVSGVKKEAYEAVVMAIEAAVASMKAGAAINAIYQAVEGTIAAVKPEWVGSLFKNVGCGIGLEFRESHLILNANNSGKIGDKTVYNLCVGLGELKDEQGKPFAIQIADTYLVNGNTAKKLTNAPTSLSAVTLTLTAPVSASPTASMEDEDRAVRARSTRVKEETVNIHTKEETRRLEQAELARQKCDEALARIDAIQGADEASVRAKANVAATAYKSLDAMPSTSRPTKVSVDPRNSVVLCPVNGQLVPFHISMIKNVQKSEEGDYFYLRIQFHIPDANGKLPIGAKPGKIFIKELSYRSKGQSLLQTFIAIQSLRKDAQMRAKAQEVKESLVSQETLKTIKDAPVRLRDVSVRPAITKGKKMLGTLIAHANGFRYITADRSFVDIVYANIKSCFLQRADKRSTTVLMHFELHNPILISKNKKTNFLQFYVEVSDGVHDVGSSSRYDEEDEARQEEEERQRRKKFNERFANFARDVEDQWQKDLPDLKLEFELPIRKLAFSGVPNKEVVDIMPTQNCLVALEDKQPLVIHMDEVEIVSLERIAFNLREFDISVVYKDFNKPVTLITSIPTKHVEDLKTWLHDSSILYYESPINLSWKKILADIKTDLREFYEEGGWSAFWDSQDDEGTEEAGAGAAEEGSGSEFELEESEASESSDEFTSDEEDSGDSSDSSSDGDDEDSEAEDWDELEKRAAEDDRRRRRDDD